MRWSVGIEAEGDRVFTREEIVELADAVAASSGVATGIGTNRYGAQLLVAAGQPRGRDRRGDASCSRPRRAPPGCRPRRSCGPRRSARKRKPRPGKPRAGKPTPAGRGDPARVAGRLPLRRPAAARRLDAAAGRGRLRRAVQAGPGNQAGELRGHLRRPRRGPRRQSGSPSSTRAPRAGSTGPAPSGRSTSRPTRYPAERRRTASRSPASWPRSTGRAATSSSTTTRGKTSGSASTRVRPTPRR